MSRTYNEILSGMCSRFKELSGYDAADASDIGIRLKLLAGEVFELEKSLDWLEGQMYVGTASGEYLDRHASELGMERRKAVKASGLLEFSRSTALGYDVLIPAGTVCARGNDSSTEYVTLSDCNFSKGSLAVYCEALAAIGGIDGNCAAGTITSLVTLPDGIEKVNNPAPFTGGCGEEGDEALRTRLVNSLQALPNGINCEYYRRAAMSFDGVGGAGIVPRVNGDGTVGVYLWGETDPPSEEVIGRVSAYLAEKREINVSVTVEAAEKYELEYVVYVSPRRGVDFETARAAAEKCVRSYFSTLQVGDPVYKAAVIANVLGNAPVGNCSIPSGIADFFGSGKQIPILKNLVIKELL